MLAFIPVFLVGLFLWFNHTDIDLQRPVLGLIGHHRPATISMPTAIFMSSDIPAYTYMPATDILENASITSSLPALPTFPLPEISSAGPQQDASDTTPLDDDDDDDDDDDATSSSLPLSIPRPISALWSEVVRPFLESDSMAYWSAVLQFTVLAVSLTELLRRIVSAAKESQPFAPSRQPIDKDTSIPHAAARSDVPDGDTLLSNLIPSQTPFAAGSPDCWHSALVEQMAALGKDKSAFLSIIQCSTAEFNAMTETIEMLRGQLDTYESVLEEMRGEVGHFQIQAETADHQRDAAEKARYDAVHTRDVAIRPRDEMEKQLKEQRLQHSTAIDERHVEKQVAGDVQAPEASPAAEALLPLADQNDPAGSVVDGPPGHNGKGKKKATDGAVQSDDEQLDDSALGGNDATEGQQVEAGSSAGTGEQERKRTKRGKRGGKKAKNRKPTT